MVKLGIFYEQDDAGKDTGRVQIADVGGDELVYDTFDTEKEAEKAMAKMQAEFNQKDELEKAYLEWEKNFLSQHSMSKDNLRSYLVNVVID